MQTYCHSRHSERSEESYFCADGWYRKKILRFAQNDITGMRRILGRALRAATKDKRVTRRRPSSSSRRAENPMKKGCRKICSSPSKAISLLQQSEQKLRVTLCQSLKL